jgi:AcrR family transcriptional regulator
MRQSPARYDRSREAAPAVNPSATRDTILAAAAPLFATGGVRGTTIRQIAAAANVNSQLIYYYFRDKHGLFRVVLEAAASRVDALLAQATHGADLPGTGWLVSS